MEWNPSLKASSSSAAKKCSLFYETQSLPCPQEPGAFSILS